MLLVVKKLLLILFLFTLGCTASKEVSKKEIKKCCVKK
tara:strand:- start:102 stop:215 length:114 start_codon:yes stop_codon:yes gene_type:complete